MRILPALFILPLFFSCQSKNEPRSISVTGTAKMKVVPDMVEVSLRAYTVKPAMRDAVAETQTAVNEILAVCKRYVTDPADIKVSSISTNKAYEYRNNSDQFIGYDAEQVLEVTLKNISQIERFTEELLATKISKIENVRYGHTKADSLLREVNLMALEDARKTAEKMCGKMNAGLGELMYLSNFERGSGAATGGTYYGRQEYDMNLYNKSFGGSGFKMTAEILEFGDEAFASFRLK